jgi:hypothetical protein
MKFGAENKKSLYALAVTGAIMVGVMYWAFAPDTPTRRVAPVAVIPDASDAPPAVPAKSSGGPDISRASGDVRRASAKSKEFHPAVIPKKEEERKAAQNADPTIRFDLLAKVMKVPAAGGERDLFQILKGPPVKADLGKVEPIVRPHPFVGPRPPPPPPQPRVEPPPPPEPIPFKFYGVSAVHPDGTRTAYFIIPNADGDEILKANEGDVLKKHFRIVQIGVDKVLVENTQDKHRQPLNMEKENTQ